MNTTALYLAHTALLLAASPCFAEEVLATWTSDEDATRVKFDQDDSDTVTEIIVSHSRGAVHYF